MPISAHRQATVRYYKRVDTLKSEIDRFDELDVMDNEQLDMLIAHCKKMKSLHKKRDQLGLTKKTESETKRETETTRETETETVTDRQLTPSERYDMNMKTIEEIDTVIKQKEAAFYRKYSFEIYDELDYEQKECMSDANR